MTRGLLHRLAKVHHCHVVGILGNRSAETNTSSVKHEELRQFPHKAHSCKDCWNSEHYPHASFGFYFLPAFQLIFTGFELLYVVSPHFSQHQKNAVYNSLVCWIWQDRDRYEEEDDEGLPSHVQGFLEAIVALVQFLIFVFLRACPAHSCTSCCS